MYVCLCNAVSDKKLRKIIKDETTLEDLRKLTGAGKNCGSCICVLKDLLLKEKDAKKKNCSTQITNLKEVS